VLDQRSGEGPPAQHLTVSLQNGENGYSGTVTCNLVNLPECKVKTSYCANDKMRTDDEWDGTASPNTKTYQQGMVKFSGLPVLPSGGKVVSSTLRLWFYPGHPCRPVCAEHATHDCPVYIDVFAMARAWTPDAYWEQDGLGKSWGQPGALKESIDFLPALRSVQRVVEPPCDCTTCFACPCSDSQLNGFLYTSKCMTDFVCNDPADPLKGGHDFDVTTIVQAWLSQQTPNHGLAIRGRWGPYDYGNNPLGCNPHVEFYFAGMQYVAPGSVKKNLLPRLTIVYTTP
jgi:hypothetical protein